MVPGRGRTIGAFGVVGLALLAISSPVLEVYSDWQPFRPPGTTTTRRSGDPGRCGTVRGGHVAAVVDRRVQLSERSARRISTATVVALAAVLVVGVAGYAVVERSPVSAASDAWSEFKHGGNSPQGEGTG